MSIIINIIEKQFTVPVTHEIEPVWAKKVERWFQLDEVSIAICNGLYEWLKQNEIILAPSIILNATIEGCHLADARFAMGGGESPALFVYTLPSIIVGVAAQYLSWKGPSFNFTGQNSWSNAVSFGDQWIASQKQNSIVWIIQVERDPTLINFRKVRFMQKITQAIQVIQNEGYKNEYE